VVFHESPSVPSLSGEHFERDDEIHSSAGVSRYGLAAGSMMRLRGSASVVNAHNEIGKITWWHGAFPKRFESNAFLCELTLGVCVAVQAVWQ
jgi:hypothetical protein